MFEIEEVVRRYSENSYSQDAAGTLLRLNDREILAREYVNDWLELQEVIADVKFNQENLSL
jgi:hypothetical protein